MGVERNGGELHNAAEWSRTARSVNWGWIPWTLHQMFLENLPPPSFTLLPPIPQPLNTNIKLSWWSLLQFIWGISQCCTHRMFHSNPGVRWAYAHFSKQGFLNAKINTLKQWSQWTWSSQPVHESAWGFPACFYFCPAGQQEEVGQGGRRGDGECLWQPDCWPLDILLLLWAASPSLWRTNERQDRAGQKTQADQHTLAHVVHRDTGKRLSCSEKVTL